MLSMHVSLRSGTTEEREVALTLSSRWVKEALEVEVERRVERPGKLGWGLIGITRGGSSV